MMKRILFMASLLLGVTCSAQNLAYNQPPKEKNKENNPSEFVIEGSISDHEEDIDTNNLPAHFLGKSVAKKFQAFKNVYVYEDGLRINIEKPIVYKSIKKINKHLIKQVKSGNIEIDIAERNMLNYLDIAIAIAAKPTSTFENALRNVKSAESLIQVFNKVKLM